MSARQTHTPGGEDLDWIVQHEALTSRAGLVDLGHRSQIEIEGADRSSWLHNLCTNEIRKLAVGAGCEMFLTSVQGKTLAHAYVFAAPNSLVLETVAGAGETILNHLDHYLICERVTLSDRSETWSELLLAGAESAAQLGKLMDAELPKTRLDHVMATLAGRAVAVRRVDWVGNAGFLLSARSEDSSAVRAALLENGAMACEVAAFEAARIEGGTPQFGIDISDKNLPQEVARDAQAISFVKGCYLGQETVARIDALGHVNKTLVGIRFDQQTVPPMGLELSVSAQPAGHVTSATYSPRCHSALALGYLRRGSNVPGTKLESTHGPAEVVALPLAE